LIWLTGKRAAPAALESLAGAERRLALARARRERLHGYGAVATTAIVLATVGIAYAREIAPKTLPAPEMLMSEGGFVGVPLSALEDGRLHRFGYTVLDRTVRFLALKTADGKVRTALDACKICGSFGYVQEDSQLICLNCSAEINPLTVGAGGGCNPIPLESEVSLEAVRVRAAALEDQAPLFAAKGE
jgi:uncharacterized membrane protein